MGGLAGHMSHLYDNPKLTFSKLKEIFIAAADGELEGTEKTDGQNLYLSFSVPDQKMEFTEDDDGPGRAARNKGNIKSGGLTVKQVVDKFSDHPNQELKKSFSQALRAFEKVVKSFPREKQVEIFGPDTNIYYNAEIINPNTPNVINYDKKLVTLHRGGGGYFDKETGSPEEVEGRDHETGELVVKERDISANAEMLAQALEGVVQDMESQGGFEVIMDAVQKLQGLEDKAALNKALADLDAKISDEGISDNQMIIEYIMARIGTIITRKGIKLKPETYDLVLKRLLLQNKTYRDAYGVTNMPSELRPKKIKAGLTARDKNKIEYIFTHSKDILKQAIQPIENVVHDFSVAMLAGLESLFILDNKKGVEKIRQKVRAAKEKIETEDSKENLNTFLRQMEKLKSIENISTAAEGFVFDYDGHTYKFTGNFAPINQILGIGKYEGRGELPSLEKGKTYHVPRETGLAAKGRMKLESDALVQEVMNILLKEKEEKLDAIYLPGGFKPPHKGHWTMVQNAAESHPGVPVYIVSGKVPRDGITLDNAEKVWNIYIEESGLDNIELIKVDEPIVRTDAQGNPRINKDGAVSVSTNPWEWIKKNVPGNKNNIGIVYSEKDKNYDTLADAHLGGFENLTVTPIMVSACPDEDRGCALSATNFRQALKQREGFEAFIPEFAANRADDILNILGGSEEEPAEELGSNPLEEMLFSIIEEVILERAVKRSCKKKSKTKSGKRKSGNCAVISHETGKQKACYDNCGDANAVMNLEEIRYGRRRHGCSFCSLPSTKSERYKNLY